MEAGFITEVVTLEDTTAAAVGLTGEVTDFVKTAAVAGSDLLESLGGDKTAVRNVLAGITGSLDLFGTVVDILLGEEYPAAAGIVRGGLAGDTAVSTKC
jgi:hypothetical protein